MKNVFIILSLLFLLSCQSEKPKSNINNKKNYLLNKDTIASLISIEPGGICNIWTKNKLESSQMDLISKITNKLNEYSENVVFFYLDSCKVGDNDYYAYYYKGSFQEKATDADLKKKEEDAQKEIVKFCNTKMKITNINEAIIFLSKVEYLSQRVKKYDDNSKIKNTVRSFQRKHFPLARKAYSDNAREKLWKKNIDVKMTGGNIIFIGYMFADNATIDATFKEISEELHKFRFKRVSFQWYEGSETTYYNLKSKNDTDLN